MTLRVVNEQMMTAEDFAIRAMGALEGSVTLLPVSMRHYLEIYEGTITESRRWALEGMRVEMDRAVERMAKAIRSAERYLPYIEAD
jgi:hypothetical protein